MFTNSKDLKGLVIRATDGEIGKVEQLYFDDRTWTVRYLVVDTGGWLNGRQVLISPMSIAGVDWQSKRMDVALTTRQVEHAPDIDLHKPVSRQHEETYLNYYGYPYYWEGPYLWGSSYRPIGMANSLPPLSEAEGDRLRMESYDSHLRSSDAVTGYSIDATDGEIGHVDRFVVDEDAWAIRYVEVATQNWWPGKKVLLSPAWVEKVSWEESKVFVGVTRKAIMSCEEYTDGTPITREYENRLHFHYGRPPYWLNGTERSTLLPAASAGA